MTRLRLHFVTLISLLLSVEAMAGVIERRALQAFGEVMVLPAITNLAIANPGETTNVLVLGTTAPGTGAANWWYYVAGTNGTANGSNLVDGISGQWWKVGADISLADIGAGVIGTNQLDSTTYGLLVGTTVLATNLTGASLAIQSYNAAGTPGVFRGAADQSADILAVQTSANGPLFSVSPAGVVKGVSFAGQVGMSNLVDTTASISTNMLNAVAHGRLERTISWDDLADIPAGFADGVDATGTSTVTGSASVSLITGLTSLEGASGAVAVVANGFTVGDGGGGLWEWTSTGTTNAAVVYGGTSGHYWKLRPVNNEVAATTLGLVGNGSTDNATKFSALTLASDNNWSVFWPAGQYNLGSRIDSANLTNVNWTGVSSDKTIVYWTHSGSSVEGWRWTGVGGKIRISKMAFKANPANDVRLMAMNGQYTDVLWSECEFSSADKIWYAWQTTSSANTWGWEKCRFHGTTDSAASAITFGNTAKMSTNLWVTDCRIGPIAGSPFEIYQVDGFRIQNNIITNFGFNDTEQAHGIYVSGTTNTVTQNLWITGNRIGDNQDTKKNLGVAYIQVYDHKPPHIGIHNLFIKDNVFGYGSTSGGNADGLYLYGVENAVVQGNVFTNIQSVAIGLGGSTKDITIDNNNIYGNGTAEYGINVGASSATDYVSSGHSITRNRIQGFLRDHIGYGGVRGTYAGNVILLSNGALEAGYSCIQLAGFTGHAVDLVFKDNVIHDVTSSPTHSWGGIRMGKAARTLTNLTTTYNNSASTTSGHLVQNNVFNDVAGAPITAGSGNKVYENTLLGTTGVNSLSGATVRNND